jgi:hypothetical protein
MTSIREVFADFLVANFALYSKGTLSAYSTSYRLFLECKQNESVLIPELTIDFIRPHECTRFVFALSQFFSPFFRRLDLLLQLKRAVIDAEPEDKAEDVFFFLKVARVFNMVMQTSCPALEDKITKYVSYNL